MKKIALLVLPLALIAFRANAQQKNIDTLLHRAFTALRNKDENAYAKLFPDRMQMKMLLISTFVMGVDPAQDSLITAAAGLGSDQAYEEKIGTKLRKEFQSFVKNAEESGIPLAALALDRVSYDTLPSKEGPKAASGSLYVSGEGKQYEIPFSDVIWSPAALAWFGIVFKSSNGSSDPDTTPAGVPKIEMERFEPPVIKPDAVKRKKKAPVRKPVKKS